MHLCQRLEIVANRIDATIDRADTTLIGRKHPREVREAAKRIAELEAALREALDYIDDPKDSPVSATLIVLAARKLLAAR